jgi:arachidonate 15-lipoxygenase
VVSGHLASLKAPTGSAGRRALLRSLYRRGGLPETELADAVEISDDALARGWLDGPNPLVLRRLSRLEDLAPLEPMTQLGVTEALGGTAAIAQALAQGTLYAVDYALLGRALVNATTRGRDARWRDKYLPSPFVLLRASEAEGRETKLELVAIRIDQAEAAGHNPVYLPSHGPSKWKLAKVYVLVADFNYQAVSSHLYRHHFLMEPIALATRRQLAKEHPLRVLLEPHLSYTHPLNRAAARLLMQSGSIFDQVYAGRLVETRNIMRETERSLGFRQQALEADIAERGVSEHPVDYPWRDDARLWNAAIDRFVKGYVETYYDSEPRLESDRELSAWISELRDPARGAIRELLPAERLDRDGLIGLLTQILFMAGPGHAAIHYPQTDYFTFAPSFPASAYLPPPSEGEIVDDARIEATLPPFGRAVGQFLQNQIAYYRLDRFGDYRGHDLGRCAKTAELVHALNDDLRAIEATIEARNRARPRRYTYLLPSLVPNSINI